MKTGYLFYISSENSTNTIKDVSDETVPNKKKLVQGMEPIMMDTTKDPVIEITEGTSSLCSDNSIGILNADFVKVEPNIQILDSEMITKKTNSSQTSEINNFITSINEKTGEKTYKCTKCGKQCSRRYNMKQHCLIHEERVLTTYPCELCNKIYLKKQSLQLHIKFHTGNGLYKCSDCLKCFSMEFLLKKHMKIHQTKRSKETESNWNVGQETYDCKHCDRKFKKKTYLKQHIRNYTAEKKYECSKCYLKFKQKHNLNRHMKTHVKKNIVETQSYFKKETNTYDCNLCDKKYKHKFTLTSHMKLHTGNNLHQCSKCYKKFERMSGLKSHLKSHASRRLENLRRRRALYFNKTTDTFDCKLCDKKFRIGYALIVHMKLHTTNNLYQCTECCRNFTQSCNLKRHMKTHTNGKPKRNYINKVRKTYDCKICHRKYVRRTSLILHMRLHTGINVAQCPACFKNFVASAALKRHMETHAPGKSERKALGFNNKTYDCKLCDKKYREKKSLMYHMRKHTQKNLVQCSICFKKFTHDVVLRKHMKSHATDKLTIKHLYFNKETNMYDCKLCDKKFTKGFLLTSHMKLHSDENPFQCSKCHVNFATHFFLKRHKLICHATGTLKDDSMVISENNASDVQDHLIDEAKVTGENGPPSIKTEKIDTVQSVITENMVTAKNEMYIENVTPSSALHNKQAFICKEEVILHNNSD